MSEQSYIIRIYRSANGDQGTITLAGIVESPESGKREAFHDCQGLWAILVDHTKPALSGMTPRGKLRRSEGKRGSE